MGQTREVEQARHDDGEPGSHQDINHQIAQRLAQHDAERAVVMALDGHQVLEAVRLTGGTCRQANAKHQRLLDNKHQHGRQDKRPIASRRTEDGSTTHIERFGLYLFLALGILARQFDLYLAVHLLRHGDSSLIGCLVSQHQTHVTIDADGRLLQAVDARLEIGRDVIDGLGHIAPHQHLAFVDIVGIAHHLDVGRRITLADELTAHLGVAVVNDDHGDLAHYLIIIYPRVKQRIDQWHQKEEDDDTFVLEGLAHLVTPDECRVATAFYDGFQESFCFHRL